MSAKHRIPDWVTHGKTIRQLIAELSAFENQDAEVRLSLDYAKNHQAISIVEKRGKRCLLVNAESYYQGPWQRFMDGRTSKAKSPKRASKKKKPNQPLQRNASTKSASSLKSPARRG